MATEWDKAGYVLAQFAQAGYHACLSRMPDGGHWCCCLMRDGKYILDAYGDTLADAAIQLGAMMDVTDREWYRKAAMGR